VGVGAENSSTKGDQQFHSGLMLAGLLKWNGFSSGEKFIEHIHQSRQRLMVSTWKKSVASNPVAWVRRKVLQVV
jgi:hypothetical protein